MNKEASWSDYWVKEGVSGEVFVGKEGKKHPYLSEFWKKRFEQFEKGAKIIDLACGGGSIFADITGGEAANNRGFQLHAVDVSAEALKQLNSRLPEVITLESSVDNIPLDSGTFDVVVSQFGIEYAGKIAFSEAARLMAEKAQLIIICHIEDGFIDSKNKMNLEGAELLERTGFIEKAIAVTETAFENNIEAFEESYSAFTKIEPKIVAFIEKNKQGIHVHCYSGFRQMYERKQHYQLSDIVGWLKAMKGEVLNTISRLSEMRKAAQSKQQVEEIRELLIEAGLVDINIELFQLPGHQLPLAWCITGTKPQ